MRKSRMAVLSILLIALLLPVVVFAARLEVGPAILSITDEASFETRVEVKVPGNRAVTLSMAASVTQRVDCINKDGELEERFTYPQEYSFLIDQTADIDNGVISIRSPNITLPSQCPNDNWTPDPVFGTISVRVSLLDVATREVLATMQCQATIDGAPSSEFPCVTIE